MATNPRYVLEMNGSQAGALKTKRECYEYKADRIKKDGGAVWEVGFYWKSGGNEYEITDLKTLKVLKYSEDENHKFGCDLPDVKG